MRRSDDGLAGPEYALLLVLAAAICGGLVFALQGAFTHAGTCINDGLAGVANPTCGGSGGGYGGTPDVTPVDPSPSPSCTPEPELEAVDEDDPCPSPTPTPPVSG